ncbi:MAG: 4-hydroxy-3-methylbut-2-enyl diphosphate reductase [Muribaculaceae bacterium]|nr:4-hydroxy-3-methylbut-2-enyl diphosphate reductase [Muribaculaceae bacterium]
MAKIEIDSGSGFCFGVVTAIRKAEEELDKSGTLYCLGDIVHNAGEVERLQRKGLVTITHADLERLHDVKVLLRAHGEPPSTYETARRNNIEIIDATCPVVLQLQRRIKTTYDESAQNSLPPQESASGSKGPLILIYGKIGHAEVNGLVGQTNGEAVVIQDISALDTLDLDRDIRLYSQTTKSLDGFREIVAEIQRRKKHGDFKWYDTICRQVSSRMSKMREFAASHDVVVFVSGAKSSNGKVLFAQCLEVNPRTHLITDETGVEAEWFEGAETIGICGATSTPRWLMNAVAERIDSLINHEDGTADRE